MLPRPKFRTFDIAVALVAAAIVLLVGYQVYHRYPRSWPSDVTRVFTAEVMPVVEVVDKFFAEKGRYPEVAEFRSLVVARPSVGMKEWEYTSDGRSFQIKVCGSPVRYPSVWFDGKTRTVLIDE